MSARFDPKSKASSARYAKSSRIDGLAGFHTRYDYSASSRLVVGVNAALATKRPLLLRGEAGSGKSTLAYDVAIGLGWSYYERVVSSRMSAGDLLWQYDAIERLNEATRSAVDSKSPAAYIHAQTLWWALDPKSAQKYQPRDPDPARVGGDGTGAVVLIDEIDKADPDLPNDLLVPIGDNRFRVPELGANADIVRTRECLIVITSNGERELPDPFLRRCICLDLETPSASALMTIAQAHLPQLAEPDRSAKKDTKEAQVRALEKAGALIDRMLAIRAACKPGQHRPGTAEVLDALRACFELDIHADHADFIDLTLAMGWKNSEAPPNEIAAQADRRA